MSVVFLVNLKLCLAASLYAHTDASEGERRIRKAGDGERKTQRVRQSRV